MNLNIDLSAWQLALLILDYGIKIIAIRGVDPEAHVTMTFK